MRGGRICGAVIAAAFLAAQAAHAEDPVLERGRRIVSGSCFLCHGLQGEAASELYPRLAAQNPEYLVKQLANFKSGERKSTTMQPMVAKLTPEDMRAVAVYFSGQRSEPHAPSDPKIAVWGRSIYERGGAATEVAACIGCHGERGHGSERLPRLAGQVSAYLVSQLKNFGTRERTNDNAVMHTVAARMTELEMKAVAEYLSGLD